MILLVDSGSTKTDWCLVENQNIIHQFKTIGINPYFQEQSEILELIKMTVVPQVNSSLSAIYYYGTGITDEFKSQILTDILQNCFAETPHIEAQSDMLGAARAVMGKTNGIACILGTGSNTCFYENCQIPFKVDALGFWLGDEGSGGHLGKLLILKYLHKEMPLDLRELFEAKFGILDRLTVLDFAYKKPNPNRYFAGFTTFLSENQNHVFCQALIKDSFRALFQFYISKYPSFSQYPLGFVGSIAAVFQQELQEVCSEYGCRVHQILQSPMEGLVKFHA